MRYFNHIISIFVVLLIASLSAPGAAQTPGDDSSSDRPVDRIDRPEQVRFLLSNIHEVPSREALTDAMADPRDLLMHIARDESAGFMRNRALMALGHFPDPEVLGLYTALMRSDQTPTGTRHKVMLRAAEVFEEASVAPLSELLDHEDLQLRLTAVEALRSIGDDSAFDALEARVSREESQVVLDALFKATRRVR